LFERSRDRALVERPRHVGEQRLVALQVQHHVVAVAAIVDTVGVRKARLLVIVANVPTTASAPSFSMIV
jgi:hypothetical protein